jgi:hypothetical protein
MSSHLQTAAEAEAEAKAKAKLLHSKLLCNMKWVLENKKEKGSQNMEEYKAQCAYVG